MSTETVATPSFDQQIAQGAAWMVAARSPVWGIGLVRIIFARFLKPSAFGLVSLEMASLLVTVSLRREWMAATPKRSPDGPERDVPRRTKTIALARIFAAFGGRIGDRCHLK